MKPPNTAGVEIQIRLRPSLNSMASIKMSSKVTRPVVTTSRASLKAATDSHSSSAKFLREAQRPKCKVSKSKFKFSACVLMKN